MSDFALDRPMQMADLSRFDGNDRASIRLVTAVQDLSLARNLETIVAIVRRAAREMSKADGATFILRDADHCWYVDEDAIGPLWKGRKFPLPTCISGWAMLNRRPAVIKDIYLDDRIPHDLYRPTFVKSLVMVPIRSEEPCGAIGIYWGERHMASELEVELLQALANTTAVAMENVRLYADLEQRVKDRTQQLEDANRELETFSYSVSHDLRAPLRHINAYAGVLLEDYANALDAEGRGYLERIQAASTNMGTLINDLLRLARFARADLHIAQVDLSALAHEVVRVFQEESPDRQADVKIAEGVVVQGDAALLKVVLENLLANAWKFTSKRERATIEFGTLKDSHGSTTYFVKDNGAGFNLKDARNLFGPLRREPLCREPREPREPRAGGSRAHTL